MKFLPGLLLSGSFLFSFAQKRPDPLPYSRVITTDSLKTHLYRLAGPEFEGRETARPGQQKAAAYIEDYFRLLGLRPGNKDSFQMSFPVFQDSLQSAELNVDGNTFRLYTDFDAPLSSNHDMAFGSSEIVYAGYGLSDSTRDDYRGLDVAGKIALVMDGYPPGYVQKITGKSKFNGYAKWDAAQLHGAAALFIIQHNFPRKPATEYGMMYRELYRPKVRPNAFYISEKLAGAILKTDTSGLRSGTLTPKKYRADIWVSFRKKTLFLQSTNVLGWLEGTDRKEEFLVISAHYDHLGKKDSVTYFGADDDGSGTVALLQLAAAFSKAARAGARPRRSIIFLANSGEEKGLWGSEYYTSHPVYPLDSTTANLNIDMIGRKDPSRKSGDSNNYVYIVGDDKLSSDLHTISVTTNGKYTGLELDYKFNDPKDPLKIYTRSDHFNFAKRGVPIIFYFDGINSDYHRPSDTPDKIDYELMLKRTRLVFFTAWEMANRKDILKRDYPPVNAER